MVRSKAKTMTVEPWQIVVCAGTCGRMTRPENVAVAAAPHTIQRVKDGMCGTCKRAAQGITPGRTLNSRTRGVEPEPVVLPHGQNLTEKDRENVEQVTAFTQARRARLARQNAGTRVRRVRPVRASA